VARGYGAQHRLRYHRIPHPTPRSSARLGPVESPGDAPTYPETRQEKRPEPTCRPSLCFVEKNRPKCTTVDKDAPSCVPSCYLLVDLCARTSGAGIRRPRRASYHDESTRWPAHVPVSCSPTVPRTRLTPATTHATREPHTARQEAPRAHSARFRLGGRRVLVLPEKEAGQRGHPTRFSRWGVVVVPSEVWRLCRPTHSVSGAA
jgi:hypothetical protein